MLLLLPLPLLPLLLPLPLLPLPLLPLLLPLPLLPLPMLPLLQSLPLLPTSPRARPAPALPSPSHAAFDSGGYLFVWGIFGHPYKLR